MKPQKLTDKELKKWLNILGKDLIMILFTYGKIKLTSEQLDIVVNCDVKSDKVSAKLDSWSKKVSKVIKK